MPPRPREWARVRERESESESETERETARATARETATDKVHARGSWERKKMPPLLISRTSTMCVCVCECVCVCVCMYILDSRTVRDHDRVVVSVCVCRGVQPDVFAARSSPLCP